MRRREFLLAAGAAAIATQAKGAAGEQSSGATYTRKLRVEHDVDVFVAGGGPAGVCAAVAAARAGKRVFLAEMSGAFGGAATAAYVPAFATFSDGAKNVVGGIGLEIRRQISRAYPLDTYWTPIDVEELKRVYDKIVVESGIGFSFFTNVCDAMAKGGRIEKVVLASKRGLFEIRARIYIDCTGDADLIAFAGGGFDLGDEKGEVMPCTLCSQWNGIDFTKPNEPARNFLPDAIKDGMFTVPDLHLPGFFHDDKSKSTLGLGNIGHSFGVNPTDERSLSKAMVDARRRLPEWERFYKKYQNGFEKMHLASTAPYLGIRESRRVHCDYTMTVGDFAKRAQFEDQVGRYCYPVDVHPSKPGDKAAYAEFLKEYERDLKYKKGESYGIPYRALIPKDFTNVLVAGRCIGTDRKMQASVRVMPGCYITGQAAGTAAALAAASGDVRRVKVAELQAKLKEAKVIL